MSFVPLKKLSQAGHKNDERWLITYADLITLLLVFFIVLYATGASQTKFSKLAKALSTSLKQPTPITHDPNVKLVSTIAGSSTPEAMKVTQQLRGVVISLLDKSFFTPGSSVLLPAAKPMLKKLAVGLNRNKFPIRVEGHTDASPISTPLFPSNWELSSARASAVVRFLIQEGRVTPVRCSAVGLADTHPVALGNNPASYQKNRRVEIIVEKPLENDDRPKGEITGAQTIRAPQMIPKEFMNDVDHFSNPFKSN
jgi:chemotaxis protein MotB